jgi:hypothetical protein
MASMRLLIPLLALLSLIGHAEQPEGDWIWKHPEPITYDSLHAWHAKGGLGAYHWPKEHKIDLNADGKDEIFLGIMGFGRGMVYALFTERNGTWVALSEEIEGSHHEFEPISGTGKPWCDFRSLQPSGRGGLIETIYSWNGKLYAVKSTREITAKELYGNQEGRNTDDKSDSAPHR